MSSTGERLTSGPLYSTNGVWPGGVSILTTRPGPPTAEGAAGA